VASVADGVAAVDTALGRMVGLNPRGLAAGDEAYVFIRPERLRIAASGGPDDNRIELPVQGEMFEGITVNVTLATPAGRPIVVTMSNDGAVPTFATGRPLRAYFGREHAIVLPPGSLARA
jgi:spermidine/putrescine transport system ATP-binding protein